MAKSDFERSAQQAAVDAVERRWKRKHDVEQRQRRARMLNNFLAGVVLLAGLAVVGWFSARYFQIDIPRVANLDMQGLLARIGVGRGTSMGSDVLQDEYVRLLGRFNGKECVLWRNAPEAIKPKTAVAGIHYLVLCGIGDDRRLYELVSDGHGSMSATALSPVAKPLNLKMSDFRAAVVGRPYFILCNDVVYAVGCKTEAAARELMAMLSQLK